jgi:hypothetical protein
MLAHDQRLPEGEETLWCRLAEDQSPKLNGVPPATAAGWIRRCGWRYPLSTSLLANGSRVVANHD